MTLHPTEEVSCDRSQLSHSSVFTSIIVTVSVTSCVLAALLALLVGLVGGMQYHKQLKKVLTVRGDPGSNSGAIESQTNDPLYSEIVDSDVKVKHNVAYEQVNL